MKLIVTLFAVCFAGCCCRYPPEQFRMRQPPVWTTASTQPARGVFVVVHGLNQKPSGMDSLSSYLASLGYNTLRLSLEGHDAATDASFPAEAWVEDVHSGLRAARSAYPKLPVFVLGYSMGGLLAVRAIEERPDEAPAKVVLVAPAIGLRTAVQAAKLLAAILPDGLRTPNLAPAKLRRFDSTPVFWYSNFSEIYDLTREPAQAARLRGTPALVILNPGDELISEESVEEWIAANQLSKLWHVELVHPQATDPDSREHVIIDQESLGEAEWLRMQELIRGFLQ